MRILVIGGGGREHALAWKIRRSPLVEALYVAPGNPGIAQHAVCVPLQPDAHDDLLAFAARERIDFTVVGPEAPLVSGVADRFAERRLTALGPGRAAAQLEGSKTFAKTLMARHGIPTAQFATFDDAGEALAYARRRGAPLVVKADGLAAGKGVMVCRTLDECEAAIRRCMEERAFGDAGRLVVVEELLTGEEVSFFALANGSEAIALTAAQDHKTVFDGDRGPNTGGMGAYSPVPSVDLAMERHVMDAVVTPTVTALAKEGMPYRGVLFVGLMMTSAGPRVLEFNCRFGDPECQALLPRMEDDLVALLLAAARGEPLPERTHWRREATVCVTVASGGYPGTYRTGLVIEGLTAAMAVQGVEVFHSGTAVRDNRLVTAGGRVLGVTATAPAIGDAIGRAYEALQRIRFDGMHYRRDIGHRALVTQ